MIRQIEGSNCYNSQDDSSSNDREGGDSRMGEESQAEL